MSTKLSEEQWEIACLAAKSGRTVWAGMRYILVADLVAEIGRLQGRLTLNAGEFERDVIASGEERDRLRLEAAKQAKAFLRLHNRVAHAEMEASDLHAEVRDLKDDIASLRAVLGQARESIATMLAASCEHPACGACNKGKAALAALDAAMEGR
jgi:uncharacterized coiled-coil DUF342 family protein